MKRIHAGWVVLWVVGIPGVAGGQTPVVFEDQHLFASDGAIGDNFGQSVSVSDTVAIVGAIRDDTVGGSSAGSAYVYRLNGANWVEEAHLFASDGSAIDFFGRSVSISGAPGNDVAIVGAYWDDTPGGQRWIGVYLSL